MCISGGVISSPVRVDANSRTGWAWPRYVSKADKKHGSRRLPCRSAMDFADCWRVLLIRWPFSLRIYSQYTPICEPVSSPAFGAHSNFGAALGRDCKYPEIITQPIWNFGTLLGRSCAILVLVCIPKSILPAPFPLAEPASTLKRPPIPPAQAPLAASLAFLWQARMRISLSPSACHITGHPAIDCRPVPSSPSIGLQPDCVP